MHVYKVNFEPNNYYDAVTRIDGKKLNDAMDDEYKSLIQNNTWTLHQLPEGKKAIGCKWVYKLKRDTSGNVISHVCLCKVFCKNIAKIMIWFLHQLSSKPNITCYSWCS